MNAMEKRCRRPWDCGRKDWYYGGTSYMTGQESSESRGTFAGVRDRGAGLVQND